MRQYLPSIAWLGGGILTVVIAITYSVVTFDIDDETTLWEFYALYAMVPVILLGSFFMALTKLRGVIDTDAQKRS
jgi:hypothetical protein